MCVFYVGMCVRVCTTVCVIVEKLAKIKIEVPEVTQSEIVQKQKLRVVLEVVSHILNLPPHSNERWNADSMYIHQSSDHKPSK